jgi:hypothetical protein
VRSGQRGDHELCSGPAVDPRRAAPRHPGHSVTELVVRRIFFVAVQTRTVTVLCGPEPPRTMATWSVWRSPSTSTFATCHAGAEEIHGASFVARRRFR